MQQRSNTEHVTRVETVGPCVIFQCTCQKFHLVKRRDNLEGVKAGFDAMRAHARTHRPKHEHDDVVVSAWAEYHATKRHRAELREAARLRRRDADEDNRHMEHGVKRS
jgi:hypothetical protein